MFMFTANWMLNTIYIFIYISIMFNIGVETHNLLDNKRIQTAGDNKNKQKL